VFGGPARATFRGSLAALPMPSPRLTDL